MCAFVIEFYERMWLIVSFLRKNMATVSSPLSPRSRLADEIGTLIPQVVSAINNLQEATRETASTRDAALQITTLALGRKMAAYKEAGGDMSALQNRLSPVLDDSSKTFLQRYIQAYRK